jgi:hypothetical protein
MSRGNSPCLCSSNTFDGLALHFPIPDRISWDVECSIGDNVRIQSSTPCRTQNLTCLPSLDRVSGEFSLSCSSSTRNGLALHFQYRTEFHRHGVFDRRHCAYSELYPTPNTTSYMPTICRLRLRGILLAVATLDGLVSPCLCSSSTLDRLASPRLCILSILIICASHFPITD